MDSGDSVAPSCKSVVLILRTNALWFLMCLLIVDCWFRFSAGVGLLCCHLLSLLTLLTALTLLLVVCLTVRSHSEESEVRSRRHCRRLLFIRWDVESWECWGYNKQIQIQYPDRVTSVRLYFIRLLHNSFNSFSHRFSAITL